MSAILLEADEIMVKPFEVAKLADLVREKVLNRKPAVRADKERVGAILRRCISSVVEDWLARAKQSKELNSSFCPRWAGIGAVFPKRRSAPLTRSHSLGRRVELHEGRPQIAPHPICAQRTDH
jgi:hypothetical protein